MNQNGVKKWTRNGPQMVTDLSQMVLKGAPKGGQKSTRKAPKPCDPFHGRPLRFLGFIAFAVQFQVAELKKSKIPTVLGALFGTFLRAPGTFPEKT